MSNYRLNRYVVLETAQTVVDGAGGVRKEWVVLGHLWVSILSASGRRSEVGELSRQRQQMRVILRAAPHGSEQRPTVNQRFRAGNRVLEILSVSELGDDGKYLSCLVQEEHTR